jgi:hypothetical protein
MILILLEDPVGKACYLSQYIDGASLVSNGMEDTGNPGHFGDGMGSVR